MPATPLGETPDDISLGLLTPTNVASCVPVYKHHLHMLHEDPTLPPFELTLCPFLFPTGEGAWSACHLMSFSTYMQYRTHQICTQFTLFPPYVLLMYLLKLKQQLAKPALSLAATMKAFAINDGNAEDMSRHIPSTIKGSPKHLTELLKDVLAYTTHTGLTFGEGQVPSFKELVKIIRAVIPERLLMMMIRAALLHAPHDGPVPGHRGPLHS